MDQALDHRTLKLALIQLPPRTEAMLDLFFSGAGRGTFIRAAVHEADALLFDQDTPDSKREAERLRQEQPKPQIGLAMRPDTELDVIWLAKPLSTQSLFEGAHLLRHRLGGGQSSGVTSVIGAPDAAPTAQANSITPELKPPVAAAVTHRADVVPASPQPTTQPAAVESPRSPMAASAYGTELTSPSFSGKASIALAARAAKELTPDADRAELNGKHDDVATAKIRHTSQLFYQPELYLQSALTEAISLSKRWRAPVKVQVQDCSVTVDAQNHSAYVDDVAGFHALAAQPLPEAPKFHIVNLNDRAEVAGNDGEPSVSGQDPATHSADAEASQPESAIGTLSDTPIVPSGTRYVLQGLLWEACLRAAQGRLPQETHPMAEVRLVRWPNLTRICRTPNTVAIAALWAARKTSLADTANALKIPQRHVFAFYSAALACDCLQVEKPAEQLQEISERERQGYRSWLERVVAWIIRRLS